MAQGKISKKQLEILEYIKSQILERGFPPAVREICEAVNLKSTSSVHSHLETLEKNNRIDALSRKARNRRDKESRAAIEALGRIGAGEAVRALLKLSQSNDIAIWEPADAALSRLENPLAVPALLHALLEEGGKPAPLLKGLGLIATPEALEGLYKALEDPRLAPEALAVLKRRKDPKTVEALEGLLERQLQTQAETGPVKYLLRSNSLCREIISALGGMGSTSALMALHRFLRNHPQAPARLRVLAARELCLQGEAGCQALAGYIGEQLDDPQRVQLLVQCLPQEGLTQALYENLNGKPADALAQALEEGQFSGVVEADDGFYLLLRKPLDLDAVAPDYFDALLQAAADSAEVSAARAYEDLNVQQFYDGLQQARAAQRGSGEGAS